MEQSFVVGKDTYTLSSVSGTVLSEKSSRTTHVSGGTSSSGKVSIGSHTTVRQDVWIKRDDNDSDFALILSQDIPLMEGQRITAISITRNNQVYWAFLRNETASTNHQLMNGHGFINTFYQSFFGCIGILAIPFFAFLVLLILAPPILFVSVPIILFIGLLTVFNKKQNKRRALFDEALASIRRSLGI